jgi:hypothetical protein
MSSWFAPDPPQPPNPVQVAGAQTAANIGTATANSYLNNVNQVTPQGSLNYDVSSTFTYTDPNDGKQYQIPRWTATQRLSPTQRYISDLQGDTQGNLAQMAQGQSGVLQNILGTPFDPSRGGNFDAAAYLSRYGDVAASAQNAAQNWRHTEDFDPQLYLNAYPDVAAAAQQSGMNPTDFARQHYEQSGRNEGRNEGFARYTPEDFAQYHYQTFGRGEGRVPGQQMAPGAGQADWLNQAGFASGDIGFAGQQQGAFGDAGNITRTYGPQDSFSADRGRIEQAMFERVNPQLQQDEARLREQLANQGIRYGSQAYEDAMRNYSNRVTDTRLGITAQGGAEQQRLMDMAAKQAGFQNEAQQQAYQQLLGRGQFANTAQQQQFAQQTARLNAYNTAQAQNLERQKSLFNAANSQRNQFMQEQYMQRNQPLNEITSLLSGSQIQQPQWLNTPSSQIPTTDMAGILNNRFTQDMAIYNSQNQNFQQLMGGIFGAIGGIGKGVALSDERAKENINRIGTVFAAGRDGEKPLPVYEYSYKADPMQQRRVGPMAQDVEKIEPRAVKQKRGVKFIDKTKLGSILRAA